MTLLHDAYTAYLSGLTTKLNEKEIWWQDKYGFKITVELVGVDLETYVVRYFYEDGNLRFEMNYCKDERHSLCKCFFDNGILGWTKNFNGSDQI